MVTDWCLEVYGCIIFSSIVLVILAVLCFRMKWFDCVLMYVFVSFDFVVLFWSEFTGYIP